MNYKICDAIDAIKLVAEVIPKINNPSDDLITQREREFGLKFSEDYRFFLKNTANLFYGTKDISIVHDDSTMRGELTRVREDALKASVPIDWLPICEDNGNYFCLLPNGKVQYWSHDSRETEVWNSLADWIKRVWLIDQA